LVLQVTVTLVTVALIVPLPLPTVQVCHGEVGWLATATW
jgi:hypothetical protein